jgi:poly(hydroxyalkanoate) depolymerase family esterase
LAGHAGRSERIADMKRILRALWVAVLPLLATTVLAAAGPASAAASLTQVTNFGNDPSNLNMYVYVPDRLAPRPALLVAIHYCTGSAQALFNGAAHDFVTAADQYGYVIVFPEATRDGHCFDVSSPQALKRGGGSDPVGIMSMVGYARRHYHVDPDRIFVTGVSSGAMMTNVLAAEYPDVFTAGAVFSGVPAGCFATTDGSLWNSTCSTGQITKTPQQWADLARSMYPGYRGRYPRMQLWHGTTDTILSYPNFGEEIKQWTELNRVSQTPVSTDSPERSWTRTRYGNASNIPRVEGISVSGVGHTLPLSLMDSYAISFFGLNGAGPGRPLPSNFQWRSSDVLISPKPDATHPIVSVKDPTVVQYKGQWLVYATTADTSGNWSMQYISFRDWKDASSATPYFLDQSPIGKGYRAAPQLFYFAPQHLWYLVYQTGGGASYSTNTDPTKPENWTAPKNFYSAMPDIIKQNIGNGFWVDMWVICDRVNCYLFSSDDNGHLYRSQTTVADFPNGMTNTVIALSNSDRFSLFEASNVYRIEESNSYLLLVEAIGAHGRYFRSWTSNSVDGMWTPLAVSETNPFAGFNNVTFSGTPWTTSISHGEMIRDGYDQTLTINPHHLRYLYQGVDPTVSTSYSQLPWRLGLLTQTYAPSPAGTATAAGAAAN